jgi:hypothetical protein
MDSLMAVELATALQCRIGIEVSALSLSDAASVGRIAARVAQYLRPAARESGGDAVAVSDLAERVRQVAAQHAGEVSGEVVAEFSAEFQNAAAPAQRLIGQTS